jgi:DNA-binding XRE family transcriptional regulator
VTIRRVEYERLLMKAGEAVAGDGPPLPKPDARGHVPAVEYLRASIARELIRDRKAAELSQSELGKLAGVRQETISRIESGKHTVSPRVMEKIERALSRQTAGTTQRGRGNRRG